MGKKFSIKKRLKSFVYAGKGIITLFKHEHNAWIHCIFTILVITAGFYFDVTKSEWVTLVLCIGIVFAAEAFNTAIEKLTDLVSPDIHPLAGKAKDLAAGAVLISAITAAIIGLIIFLPYII